MSVRPVISDEIIDNVAEVGVHANRIYHHCLFRGPALFVEPEPGFEQYFEMCAFNTALDGEPPPTRQDLSAWPLVIANNVEFRSCVFDRCLPIRFVSLYEARDEGDLA